MNDNDLRDCFAMFAMAGLLMRGSNKLEQITEGAYALADHMMETRKHKENDDEEDVGIARVAPKRSYKRKS